MTQTTQPPWSITELDIQVHNSARCTSNAKALQFHNLRQKVNNAMVDGSVKRSRPFLFCNNSHLFEKENGQPGLWKNIYSISNKNSHIFLRINIKG